MKKIDTHKISKYMHGTFAEFFGRTTYDGIWVGKDSSIPNVNGIRRDVIDSIRECGLTVFRWPGGCCAEKYHWMDGVGKDRQPRMHFAHDRKPQPRPLHGKADSQPLDRRGRRLSRRRG